MTKTSVIDYFKPMSKEEFDNKVNTYFKDDKEAIEKLNKLKNKYDKKIEEQYNKYNELLQMDSTSFLEYSYKELKKDLEKSIDIEQLGKLIKRIKDDIKNSKKGKAKKIYLGTIISNPENFITLSNIYQHIKMVEEKKEKFKNLNDESLAQKAGWYNKKEMKDITPLLKWADDCYPDYNVQLIESQFESEILNRFKQDNM